LVDSELYQNEKIFKELFDNINNGVGIYETNDNGKNFIIRDMNRAGLAICETTRENAIGKNLIDIFPNLEKFGYIDALRRVWKTATPERLPKALSQDNSVYSWTEMYIYKLPSEKIVAIFGSTLDIIEKRIANRKLEKSEEKYRRAYYQTNLYRDIFAHDINNILQNINSSVELSSLYLNNPEKLNTIKELYEIINEQVNRAKKLISNVRKITEIDESEIKLEKIDLNRILKNAIELLQSSYQNRIINIQSSDLTKKYYVYANNLLLDVFENILINAVRHNNKSKIEIYIEISHERKEERDYVKIEFKDNGIGISDYRKVSIFERGNRKYQKSKGMGLGLSLVKKVIDLYQGKIWVEDRVKGDYKQGSNFVLLIPLSP